MQYIQYVDVTYLPHYYVLIFVYFRYFPPFHRRKDAMTLQLLTAQNQLGTSLVVELRGDIQALGLGELVERLFLRYAICQKVAFFTELKFQPCNFLPRWSIFLMAFITSLCCLPVSSAIMQLIPYFFHCLNG